MRILITGADGFVGQHLARELIRNGHQVVQTDIQDTDLAVAWNGARLLGSVKPDYVVHLAARYGRILCADEPHKAVVDNAASTAEIAVYCADHKIPLLYTSTSEVYGEHGEHRVSEHTALLKPTTVYGLSKRWGEEAIEQVLDPWEYCIVRPNMLYGPGQKAGYGQCALASFIQRALKDEPITVHKDASRSWLYIGDAVRALRILIEGGHRGVFNMGNGHERYTMKALASLVHGIVRSRSELVEVDAPANQIRHKNYDSDKLERTTGWRPRVGLQEGIEATLKVPAFVRPEPLAADAYDLSSRSHTRLPFEGVANL